MRILRQLFDIQKNTLGINERNSNYVYKHNPRKYFPLANDKVRTKKILHQKSIPAPETYAVVTNMGEISKCWESVQCQRALAIKPAKGSGGGGILVIQKDESGHWIKPSGKIITQAQIYEHLANIIMGVYSTGNEDKVIIEYCIQTHEWMRDIYPEGVPDLRVLIFNQELIMAMLRVPTKESGGKANLHQKAMGIAVDLKSGELGHGFCGDRSMNKHPDSQVQFYGLKLPFWEEILSISRRTAEVFPLNYLGVDLVLDQKLGPMVMEINARPGLQIQNINQQGLVTQLRKAS